MSIGDRIKTMIKSWLDIRPSEGQLFAIDEDMNFETNCIKNKIWYRGSAYELGQFYGQMQHSADTFWGSAQTSDIKIKKSHSGLPKLIVKTLINTVLTDYEGDDCTDEYWKQVDKENNFAKDMLKEIIADTLAIGDGAIKLNYDSEISENAILEWVDGSRVNFIYKRGRLLEIDFKSYKEYNNETYELHEIYGYGYIKYKLTKSNNEYPLNVIPELADLNPITFDKNIMWAIPVMFTKSSKYKGRGESIFDGKYDSFDSLDEIVSQWIEAIRAGRAIRYIPESMIPRNPETGELMMSSNSFDNKFIKVEDNLSEKSDNKMDIEQPSIPTDNYLQSYITFLDLCLQGIVSPSTLGIDTKKLDNAEAQREKEKTTLYTRGVIIDVLDDIIPKVINMVLKSKEQMNGGTAGEDIEISVKFGEYNNPSFEAQVETVSKGKAQGIMSIETCVDELYGDTRDSKWKEEEVARLKSEQGITEMEEPSLIEDVIDDEEENEEEEINE